jgi:hypothetical protein
MAKIGNGPEVANVEHEINELVEQLTQLPNLIAISTLKLVSRLRVVFVWCLGVCQFVW